MKRDRAPAQKSVRAYRSLPALSTAAGAVLGLLPCIWAVDPFGVVRAGLVEDQFLAVELATAFAFLFWYIAETASSFAYRATFFAAGLVSAGLGIFLFGYFGSEDALFIAPTATLVAVSLAVMLLSVVGVWLSSGRAMMLFLIGVLVSGYAAQYFPSPFDAPSIGLDRYVVYLVFGGNGLIGRALDVIAGTVVIYMLFGAAYDVSGGTEAIDRLARRLSSRGKGVAIRATVVSSGLFGMVSGSATSNVLTSGAFTIPAMQRLGLSANMAGGIEAVSSTMGQVTPPIMGAAAFLMADLTGLSYGQIALAAAIPSLICYAVMFQQAGWMARRLERNPGSSSALLEEDSLQSANARLHITDLWHVLPLAVIVLVMLGGDRMTEVAGISGICAALLSGLCLHGPKALAARISASWQNFCKSTATLVVAGSALGVVVGILGMTGLDVHLTLAIREVGQASLLLSLLLTACASLLLGAAMATTGVYIIVGTLLAPGLIALGVQPIAAHMFVFYYGIVSMVTPPVAFAALAASGISGASFVGTAWAAMRYGWIIYAVPFAFVYAPELLLEGGAAAILARLVAALVVIVAFGRLIQESGRRFFYAASAFFVGIAAFISAGDESTLSVILTATAFLMVFLSCRSGSKMAL